MNKFYITAAIPYVNANPHLGHALEFVQCDVISRFHRLLGVKTLLLTGADENSLKNVQAAEKLDIDTKKLCDNNSKKFRNLITALNASFDVFQRSTDSSHILGSQKLWKLCDKNGDIYQKRYQGLYCVGCETFYTKDELTKEGKCPEHLTVPQKVSEENYFFRLSRYQERLLKLIESDELKIIPQTRRNEILSFIKMGLSDFSISRNRERAKNWGISVPNDPNQIIYVWFDALNVYQTGVGFYSNEKLYNKWWPADLHVIGKGITRFHAVYWPAILLSAGLTLPKSIFVHGYITIEGQKMSKTLGNIIDPFVIINKYGADALRYYLLREIPAYGDGDFSEKRFKEIYNADLANNLGNLISRLSKLSESIKTPLTPTIYHFNNIYYRDENKFYKLALEEYRFHDALAFIWKKITQTNKTLDVKTPWKLKGDKLFRVISPLIDQINEIAVLLQPLLSYTSEKILKQFKGPKITSQPPLFPRFV